MSSSTTTRTWSSSRKSEKQVDTEREELRRKLTMSVNEIELSVRAANCLNNANITTVGELAQKTEAEMLKYRNFGKKSLNEIKQKLTELGLSLGHDLRPRSASVHLRSRGPAPPIVPNGISTMRHRKRVIKLGRTSAHRDALLAGLVCDLIGARRIKTTLPKARAARQLAERMVTLGKKAEATDAPEKKLHYRRRAISRLKQPERVAELFEHDRAGLRGPGRGLHPHRQAGDPPQRQLGHGLPRVGGEHPGGREGRDRQGQVIGLQRPRGYRHGR